MCRLFVCNLVACRASPMEKWNWTKPRERTEYTHRQQRIRIRKFIHCRVLTGRHDSVARWMNWLCMHRVSPATETASRVPGIAARCRLVPLAWLHESSDEWRTTKFPSLDQNMENSGSCCLRFWHVDIAVRTTAERMNRARVCAKWANRNHKLTSYRCFIACTEPAQSIKCSIACTWMDVRCDLRLGCERRNRVMRCCLYYTGRGHRALFHRFYRCCWCRRSIHAANFCFGSVVSWLSIDYVRVTVVRWIVNWTEQKEGKKYFLQSELHVV